MPVTIKAVFIYLCRCSPVANYFETAQLQKFHFGNFFSTHSNGSGDKHWRQSDRHHLFRGIHQCRAPMVWRSRGGRLSLLRVRPGQDLCSDLVADGRWE